MRTLSDLGRARSGLLFALVVTAGMLNLVDRQIIAVLKPVIAADLGWTDNDYGTLAAWFQAGAAVGFLASGWIVDRLGVRWSNPFAVATWSVAALLHGWTRSLAQFVMVRVALGATEAMGTPAGIKTVAAILPPAWRSTGFGIGNASNSVGAILAPLAIPAIAIAFGWRGTFVAMGIAGLCWAAAWLAATAGVSFAPAPTRAASTPDDDDGYGAILTNRRTWAVAGAKLLSDATWWLLLFWLPDFFHQRFGITGVALGLPLAIAYGGAALGSLVGGGVPTRLLARGYGLDRVRKGAMLVAALCVVPVPFALAVDGYPAVVFLMALALAGHQAFSTNLFALIADVVPQAKVGRVTSFGSFNGNVGGVIIAKVAGLLLTAGLGYLPLLLFASLSYLGALAWIQLLLPRLAAFAGRDARERGSLPPRSIPL